MDRFELAERERLAREEADKLRRAAPRVFIESPPSNERHATRSGERRVERDSTGAWDRSAARATER